MSTTLLLARRLPALTPEEDPAKVKSTVTTVDAAEPAAVQPSAPSYNALITDTTGEGGLTPSQLASYVEPSVKASPQPSNGIGDAEQTRVNDGIATLGTAAAREAAGTWGHGTLKKVVGIEPALSDGSALGQSYFAVDDAPSVSSTPYMTATNPVDPGVQATGNDRSREAAANPAAAYDAFLASATGVNR